MSLIRQAAALLLGLILVLDSNGMAAVAAGPQASGSGVMRSPDGLTAFVVELDDTRPPIFSYWDYASDPPRVLVLNDQPAVDCLGELFGGQTMRLTGPAQDSAFPGQTVTLQIFLVDGGDASRDRLSLKATRPDGTVAYFTPLRSPESGTLTLSCPA